MSEPKLRQRLLTFISGADYWLRRPNGCRLMWWNIDDADYARHCADDITTLRCDADVRVIFRGYWWRLSADWCSRLSSFDDIDDVADISFSKDVNISAWCWLFSMLRCWLFDVIAKMMMYDVAEAGPRPVKYVDWLRNGQRKWLMTLMWPWATDYGADWWGRLITMTRNRASQNESAADEDYDCLMRPMM